MENRLLYEGQLSVETQGDSEDVLCLSTLHLPLAEELEYVRGRTVSCRYWVTDKRCSKEEAQEKFMNRVFGVVDAEFSPHYTEHTGYLWTDEDLMVGGHDLLAELKSHDGKWLILEIEIHEISDGGLKFPQLLSRVSQTLRDQELSGTMWEDREFDVFIRQFVIMSHSRYERFGWAFSWKIRSLDLPDNRRVLGILENCGFIRVSEYRGDRIIPDDVLRSDKGRPLTLVPTKELLMYLAVHLKIEGF